MLVTSSYLYDYVVENAEFFNEFDRSNFITNASFALTNKAADLSVSIKGNQYSHILEKTISHINEITIDSYAVSEFVTKILGSSRVDEANLTIPDISKPDLIVLKPQYLTEAVINYRDVINGIASGKYDTNDIKGFYANVDSYASTLKKRVVSTNITIDYNNPKDLIKNTLLNKTTVVTTKYLEDAVLPFLQDVPKKKKDFITELSSINSVVSNTISDLKKLMEDINIGISLNKIDDTKKKLMLNYTYNYVRAILEAVSYITYASIKKVHQFEESVVVCQKLYNNLILVFNDVSTIIEAGTFDKKVISATDANDMAEKMVEGTNDVFAELAHNIIEYHRGYIATHIPNDSDISAGDTEDFLTTFLSNRDFKHDMYQDLIKSYIEIGNGLDILAKNCDDVLLIFEEILKKAGFALELVDRFHNEIEAIDDLSMYGITDLEIGNCGEKTEVYYTILAEINAYPTLTSQIAKACKAIQTKADYVEDLFNHKKNGELAYSETMNELKIFLDSFRDQFRKYNAEIVTGLYYRLKSLAVKADECLDNVYSTPESDMYTADDFFREAMISNIEENELINDVIMETLLKEYYAEREFKERGVRLVYEADNGNATAVKVVDNGNGTSSTSNTTSSKVTKETLDNLLKNIGEWFDKMINTFEEVLGRQKTKNLKWLSENKEGLTNRSYSNVEIQILPYDKMPSKQVSADIAKLSTNVSAMSIQNIQGVNSYEDLRTRLINFGPKFNKDDEKVTITNYYKVGNNKPVTVSYANNNIKTLVVNEMIPYCENFYDSYKEEIKKQLGSVKTAMENISKTYVTESVTNIDNMMVFTEAETAETNTVTNTSQSQTEKPSSLSDKSRWTKQLVQNYSGSVLNAIRDRNNDYFKVLFALAPKTTSAVKTEVKAQTETDINQ
jgi:hypothetical protein